jgi:hypothetical protein
MSAFSNSSAGAIQYVDGISDQDLPQWDDAFTGSPFAGYFRSVWVPAQISWARYVVQWNVMTEASNGPNGNGDYREQFEAWLEDVHSMGLKALVGLTSYTGVYPTSTGAYQLQLEEVLRVARAAGEVIGSLEAWNEPNSQGRLSATTAAELANTAHGVCLTNGCVVIAGDFADLTALDSYEAAYVKALSFTPTAWGVHPYNAVREHTDARLLAFKRGLPGEGAGARIWFTEVGAYYCLRGVVRGEPVQASDATYLAGTLIHDTVIAPVHVFYYGFLAGDRAPAKCSADGGADTELYSYNDRARLAAGSILASANALEAEASNAILTPSGELSVLAADGNRQSVSFLSDQRWWIEVFNITGDPLGRLGAHNPVGPRRP